MNLNRAVVTAVLLTVSAQAADWMRLETAPGIVLATDGTHVVPEIYEGRISQLWMSGPKGTWRAVSDPRRCLVFAAAEGDTLTLGPCTSALLFHETNARGVHPEAIRAVVDTTSRDGVIAFYNQQFKGAREVIGFTGDVGSCNAGSTNAGFRAAVLRRVNYYRAMAGLADAALDDNFSTIAQSTALLQAANVDFNSGVSLSHTPPNSWKCYSTVGADGAGKSNLAAGMVGWDAVSAYVDEADELGHRRWVLYPALGKVGTGDVPAGAGNIAANALYVIDRGSNRDNPTMRDGFVAWPPKGFVPYTVAYGTWSLSVPGADFSKATLTLTDGNGAAIEVRNARQLANGYGDNTYSFEPVLRNVLPGGRRLGPRPPANGPDLAYTVKLTGVQVSGAPKDYTYTVTLVDLADPVTDLDYTERASSTDTPQGELVGSFALRDPNPDPNPQVTYTLVAGNGSDDNAAFLIDGSDLKAATNIDFTQKSGWKIRVRGDNGRPNGIVEKAIVVCPFGHPTIQ